MTENGGIRLSAEKKAEEFIRNEKQFQLGFLPTENPNPKTFGLEKACMEDLPSGIVMLAGVDRDMLPRAKEVFLSEEYSGLGDSFRRSLLSGGRIIFSGCGATGRLAILLETSWRKACRAFPCARHMEDRVISIMTGGDYALVRSVESFEDYMSFGRRQAEDSAAGPGDTFVAISEGGETSSVIGSALFAASAGADVFFAFNNPAEVLCEKILRSKEAITHPRITPIDLCTGPMALTGSTRMQAATIELLVLGRALEDAFAGAAGIGAVNGEDPADTFEGLLNGLFGKRGAGGICSFVEFETGVYSKGGLVTYFADRILLDIFTDTAERAPTFMLPPFVKHGDNLSPQSRAFVKNPFYPTEKAWTEVLGRRPRCLEWTAEDYRLLGAPEKITNNPPPIGPAEIIRFRIGNERDEKRFSGSASAAAAIMSVSDIKSGAGEFLSAFKRRSADYPGRKIFFIGDSPGVESDITVPCGIKETPLMLWEHLAVKLAMNTVSTASMARLGRVRGNWMAWVEATNKKLLDRSTRLIAELCGLSYRDACVELFTSIQEIDNTDWTGKERPSPVRHAAKRLGC